MRLTFLLLLQGVCLLAAPAPEPAPEPHVVTLYTTTYYYTTTSSYSYNPSAFLKTTSSSTAKASPTITTPSVITTIIDTTSYPDITVVWLVVPYGSIRLTSLSPYGSPALVTSYGVPVTYRPHSACSAYSQTWSLVSTMFLPIRQEIATLMSPVTVFPSVRTQTWAFTVSTVTEQISILNPTNFAQDRLNNIASEYEPWAMDYCYTPTTTCFTSSATATSKPAEPTCKLTWSYDYGSRPTGSSSTSSSLTDDYLNRRSGLLRLYLIIIVVSVAWTVAAFALGLFQSWRSFKGLMLGKRRRRGIPPCWMLISLWFMCCMGPTYKAKSEEEQAVLRDRWEAMGGKEKFVLWWKWGFRWKYPTMLGDEPEIERQPVYRRMFGNGQSAQ